jgi:molybdopterin-binding protein
MVLLTVRAAAERLGVSYSTLKQWIYSGTVRTTTTAGGHHRIPQSEVDRLVARANPTSRGVRVNTGSPQTLAGLSARNRFKGYVEEVRVDGLLAQVRLRIGDQTLTAVITGDAVDELRLRRGDTAIAIIKSTEVMIAREADTPAPSRTRRRRRKS